MRVLLVEDDAFKQTRIEKILHDTFRELKLEVAKSVCEAVNYMQGNSFDHIILDIALPSHGNLPGGGAGLPMPAGGVEVLLELSYQDRPDLVTILTQYPEIEFDGRLVELKHAKQVLRKAIGTEVVDVIHFEMDSQLWKELLVKAVVRDA